MTPELRTTFATRYVQPLREGGSMPAIVECDDGFLYVLKFRGAGQGTKALIAELIGGEIARRLGLHVPELVFIELAEGFGRMEGDEEIQDLLKASVGLNLGLHYLSGSITFDPVATILPADLASRIVWLDAFLLNVDRTVRNTNMLWWNKELWLIDHGASLYFHHSWNNVSGIQPFPLIRNHVLLPYAKEIQTADAQCRQLLNAQLFEDIVALIPEEWLDDLSAFPSVSEVRSAYVHFLTERWKNSQLFVTEIKDAGISSL